MCWISDNKNVLPELNWLFVLQSRMSHNWKNDKNESISLGGGRHSTGVAFALPTSRPRFDSQCSRIFSEEKFDVAGI